MKISQISRAIWALSLVLLLAGCFHKDVMTDRADDVLATLLYQGKEGAYVITREEIFQATSKSSGGGMTRISGHSEYRLTSYRVATGEIAGRVELGGTEEEMNELLGYSEGKIWMFSLDPELGLHYRNPTTLEVVENWEQLRTKPGLDKFQPAKPDWPLIWQYYAYDWVKDQLLITDEGGFKYAIDPATFAVTKYDGDLPRIEWGGRILSGNGQWVKDEYLNLEGEPRKQIKYKDKQSGEALSFLDGEYIIDPDPVAAAIRLRKYLEGADQLIQSLRDSIVAFKAAHPELNTPAKEFSWERNTLDNKIRDFSSRMEETQRERDRQADSDYKLLGSPLLTADDHSAYLFHASRVSDTAQALVSRVNFSADWQASLGWTTALPNVFHNYSAADQAGAFETVYSKGNPSFDYMWAGTDGNYLILILQLRMLALDLRTGKVVWNIEL